MVLLVKKKKKGEMMSADNTIVIVQLTDRYMVSNIFAFEGLYWSHLKQDFSDEIIYPRVFEYFKKAKIFYEEEEAIVYSEKLFDYYSIVEYGIRNLEINKNWKSLLEESRKTLSDEKIYLASLASEKNDFEKEKINDLITKINYTYSDILNEIIRRK